MLLILAKYEAWISNVIKVTTFINLIIFGSRLTVFR